MNNKYIVLSSFIYLLKNKVILMKLLKLTECPNMLQKLD